MENFKVNKYVCGLCGKTHYELDDYLACVARCGAELKAREEAEAKQKHLEEVNAALNGIKQARSYYEDLLYKFKEKYPEEYKLNFGHLDTEECGADCKDCGNDCQDRKAAPKQQSTSKSLSYTNNGKDKPTITAKINGKNVALEKLFDDPDCKYLAKLLGIL
jgi:hypothetical protein